MASTDWRVVDDGGDVVDVLCLTGVEDTRTWTCRQCHHVVLVTATRHKEIAHSCTRTRRYLTVSARLTWLISTDDRYKPL